MKSPTRNLETSRGLISYETYDFIDEVGKRPILWLKSEMKKRAAIERAWVEVSRIFVPFFDKLNKKEQLVLTDHFKITWRRTIKSLMKNYSEKESGNTKVPLYRYTRDLDFYLKSRGLNIQNVASEQELEELDKRILKRNQPNPRKTRKVIDLSVASKKVKMDNDKNHVESKKPTKTPTTVNDDYTFDTVNICNVHNSKHEFVAQPDDDADQAFFDSLKPTLCKLNDSQKLEFMVEVLKVIKKYQTF